MRKVISSELTILCKFVSPVSLLAGILYFYWKVSADNLDHFDLKKELTFISITIGVYFLLWFDLRFKKVTIWGNFLYVSNFWREIKIPVTEIENITEFSFLGHNPVTIHLKHPTGFGKKIIFMPTYRFFSLFSSHPIIRELRNLAGI